MAAAPAIVQFVGGTPPDAIANTPAMLHITLGRNPAFTLPALNFGGTPAGIDARTVVDTGMLPIINTGIAHREAGRRPDRRRHHARAAGVLHAGASPRSRARYELRRSDDVDRQDRGRRGRRQRADHRRRAPVDPRPVRRRRADRAATSSTWSSAGWNVVRHPRQRAAGRLHPAPLGARHARGAAGADGLRRRRHPGRDRLHVRSGAAQRIPPARHRRAGRSPSSRRPWSTATIRRSRIRPSRSARTWTRRRAKRIAAEHRLDGAARTPGAAGGAWCPRRSPQRDRRARRDPVAGWRGLRRHRLRRRRHPGGRGRATAICRASRR